MSDPRAPVTRNIVVEDLSSLWWLPLVRGVLLFVLGVYAVFRPAMTFATLAHVAGFLLILDEILAIAAGAMGRPPSRLWTVVHGVVAVLAGLFVFANPVVAAGLTATFVMTVIGVMAVARRTGNFCSSIKRSGFGLSTFR